MHFNFRYLLSAIVMLVCVADLLAQADRGKVSAAMKKAATFYREQLALRGGYVYYYSPDLRKRLAEGPATSSQICVQPPATPTVGMAYLAAFKATGDEYYLEAARETAQALVYGQLKSGGWTQVIDFNSANRSASQYRNGKGNRRGKNNSTLDDGQSQSAMRFLIHCDEALGFKDEKIHEASRFALEALLKAQFPNGGFPQVWTGPVARHKVVAASYPSYDWRTQGRVKDYWNRYTLNDGVAGYVLPVLIDAHRVYRDKRFARAIRDLGDFLILAQMPDPQPAWAQQYGYDMHPIWARRFEPPAVSGGESQDVMEVLMEIHRQTGDAKYLRPIPKALAYMKRSLLPDGRLARYYELRNNRPLYMTRRPGTKDYRLTNSDSNLPSHYGWKIVSRLDAIEREFNALKNGHGGDKERKASDSDVLRIVRELDTQGRWISRYSNQLLVGQPKFRPGEKFIASGVFSEKLTTLADWLSSR